MFVFCSLSIHLEMCGDSQRTSTKHKYLNEFRIVLVRCIINANQLLSTQSWIIKWALANYNFNNFKLSIDRYRYPMLYVMLCVVGLPLSVNWFVLLSRWRKIGVSKMLFFVWISKNGRSAVVVCGGGIVVGGLEAKHRKQYWNRIFIKPFLMP